MPLPPDGPSIILNASVVASKGFSSNSVYSTTKAAEAGTNLVQSPAYQEILHLRTDHGVGDVILIEGVGPNHTPGKFAQQIRDKFATGASEG